MQINDGLLSGARQVATAHFDERNDPNNVNLLVIHNISLPPAHFGGSYIEDLFTGNLNPDSHEYFKQIYQLRVSAHCLIRRDGEVVQFVPFEKRAWHAGFSSFQGRNKCNDFSVGIELEGTDHISYTERQYQSLLTVSESIIRRYPKITIGSIVGHQDIAPGRKTDPGVSFDWGQYRGKMMKIFNKVRALKENP